MTNVMEAYAEELRRKKKSKIDAKDLVFRCKHLEQFYKPNDT